MSTARHSIVSFCIFVMFAAASVMADDTSSGLTICRDNPHYLAWRGEPRLLVTSGEHYGAVLNLDFDYRRYLETLQADGLNLTRLFSGAYREDPTAFAITNNTLAPAPLRYLCPWKRSDKPGYADGGNRFDLDQFDPDYLARLRDFIIAAGQREIIVELNLFCPMYNDQLWQICPMNSANNVNELPTIGANEVYTLQHERLVAYQVALTRYLVTQLNDLDNVYFEVCNEPYFGGVTKAWQHHIVDTITATEDMLPRRHLISMNIANGRQTIDDPHPHVSLFNFHYCVPPDVVALNRALPKPIGENETGFRGADDLLYRTEAWDFLLAGGALFNNLDYSFTAAQADGTFTEYHSPGGGSVALRHQLGLLRRFVESFDFIHMQNDTTFSVRGDTPWSVTALSLSGQQYAAYVHVPLPEKPEKLADLLREHASVELMATLPAATYRIEWVDTKSGAVGATSDVQHTGGPLLLKSPEFANDIALRIIRHE